MIKRGIVLIGGNAPEKKWYEKIARYHDMVVAADSGLDLAISYGISHIDRIVGDMDSLKNSAVLDRFEKDRIDIYSHEKDETDTEIGLRTLRNAGCTDLTIWGGGGGRNDHFIAILSLFDRELHPRLWVTDKYITVSVDQRIEISGKIGKSVSFFPAGRIPCKMASRGLKWPLDSLSWQKGDVGISNLIIEDTMSVTMIKGRLIMVAELDMLEGVLR